MLQGEVSMDETPSIMATVPSQDYPFSPSFMEKFNTHPPGCSSANTTAYYQWRNVGLGSNLNIWMEIWINHIVCYGNKNLAIVESYQWMHDSIFCEDRVGFGYGDTMPSGLDCLFRPMPHICKFPTRELYQSHMAAAGVQGWMANVPPDQLFSSRGRDLCLERGKIPWEQRVAPGEYEARKVLLKFMLNHLQPWVKRDLQALEAALPCAVRRGHNPYIGIQVRRGDKVADGAGKEAELTPVKVYLEEALRYLEAGDGCRGVGLPAKAGGAGGAQLPNECGGRRVPAPSEIKGVYLASDDQSVVEEVKRLVPEYFDQVEAVTYASGGLDGVLGLEKIERIPTTAVGQSYQNELYLLFDLHQLANADVFVGTYSSNIARLVNLMRANVSSIGVEPNMKNWFPGRRW